MSNFMPVPSPSPAPSPEAPSQSSDDKGLWGHIADVADFLFATKSLGRLLTGEGGWGDLGMVGITAASFFIPPVRLLKFGAKPLESVIAHAAEVVASDTASVTAKRMAGKTAENARYLLDNPGKHDELVRLASTTDNAEIAKLNNLSAQADEFLTSGTVPEPPVRKVGELSPDEIDPSVAKDIAGFKASETPEIPNRTEPTSAALAERSGETRINKEGQEYVPSKPLSRVYDEQGQLIEDSNSGITRQLYQEGEDIKPLGSLAEHEELLPDYVKYSYLKEDEITAIREKFSPDRLRQEGKSEAQIAEVQRDMEDELRVANIYAKGYATSSKIRSVDEAVIKATKEYDASRIESMKAANAVAESRGQSAPYDIAKETKALQDFRAKQSARKFGEEPRTFEEMTAAEKNQVDKVQAEFPVTAEGKPITRRMEDAMPEDMRTGNLKIDRTAWLISESKKLENFLKKKPANAGEIRATKDLWNKKASELQLKMTPDERIQANELADQLTERSLADYRAGKATVKRGVLDFDVTKETDVAKLTDARTKLIDDWRAETDPDLKKAIAFTGKKVAARIDELNKPPVVSSVVENSTLIKVRPQEVTGLDSSYSSLIDNIMNDIVDEHIGKTITLPPSSSRVLRRFEELGLEPPSDNVSAIQEIIKDENTFSAIIGSEEYTQLATKINEHFGGPTEMMTNDAARNLRNEQTTALQDKIKNELIHTATLKELSRDPNKLKELQNVETYLNETRNGQVCLSINGFDLVKVFKDRMFKNQFETNTSRGTLNHSMRSEAEAIQHDIWFDAKPSERPVYGYIAKNESDIVTLSTERYGSYRIVFKPHVRSRTTFTYGDSLGSVFGSNTYLPVPMEGELKPNQIFQALDLHDLKRIGNDIPIIHPNIYTEAQIFGPIKIEDIKSIHFTNPHEEWAHEELDQLKEIFKTHNIEFKIHENTTPRSPISTLDG